MKNRMISASLLGLVVGLAMLAPAPASGQHTRLIFGSEAGIWVPATDQQIVRVTIGNPSLPGPAGDGHFRESSFTIELDSPAAPVTIGPGESFTYTLDPREVGVVVDPNTGLRHVLVSFRFETETVEGSRAPQPSLTIEIVNARTRKLDSFHAFPGFSGGVFVAS